MSTTQRTGSSRVYQAPAAIASVSLLGLVSALLGDGVFNAVSWIALGAVPCVVAWAYVFRRRRDRA
ncbi:hypothetical protein IP90_00731 [Luteimonas cucumeris]|uniref:Uncharacterized protein n=1 Tax=Luteimonas cucumeris TaxID=985012 RepID=A0A562LAG5_9GAMM|nr:hypothetical protein [Luteimonas cucumeris]TWI04598.1 hypothetical protein IP90_00731 [Luteimonas cucumeris]